MKSYKQQLVAAAIAAGIIVIGNIVIAAQSAEGPDRTMDKAERSKVIGAVLENINRAYVFPDVAKRMEAHVRGLEAKGEYDSLTSGRKFAEKLTADLQSISNDKHLRVRFSYDVLPVRSRNDRPSEE